MNNSKLDISLLENVQIDGIDTRDYPDFCDAYISHAEIGGRELTEAELDWVNDNFGSFIHELASEQACEGGADDYEIFYDR